MKPKNKTQKNILAWSRKFRKISAIQSQWASDNCFPKLAYRTKKEYVCFECGHRWPNKGEENTCPECGSAFEFLNSKARSDKRMEYMAILTVSHGYQVVRYFAVQKKCKVGFKADYFISEVVQHWINARGEVTLLAINTGMSYFYYDLWSYGSKMQIRGFHQRHRIFPFVYPRQNIIPVIKRNGLAGDLHDFCPYDLLPALIKQSKVETLFKAKQFDVLAKYFYKSFPVDKYWPMIKICIRNNYLITDAQIWEDYLTALSFFGKDTRNSKFICPENLNEAHDFWVKKLAAYNEKIDKQEKEKKIRKAEIEYQKEKQKYFDLIFKKDDIQIAVLKNVNEFLEEGNDLQHCVFENEYFKKRDSLILSAKKGEQRLETVEVSLKDFDVMQSRGMFNQETEYHDLIIKTVKKNMRKIERKALELEVA